MRSKEIGHFVRELPRNLTSPALGFLFPTEVIENAQSSVEKAKRLLKEGYGLIVIYNHYSLDDPLRVLKVLHSLKLTEGKRIVHPLASHQSKNFPGLTLFGKTIGVDLTPIVTKNTVKLEKATDNLGNYSLGSGTVEFMRKAADLLKNGGIVVLAPQIERQEKLNYENLSQRTLGKFFANLKRKKVEKVALLIMGVDIKGTNSYSKKEVGGINVGRDGIVRIGRTLTLEEIKKETENTYQGQKYWWDAVDAWTVRKLMQVVSSRYARK